MMISLLLGALLFFVHDTLSQSCCYNGDCHFEPTTDLDECFMDTVYGWSNDENEGFCWDGSCYWLFGWRGKGECTDYGKKTVGESCKNAGGNYDNNHCVTQFCNDESGVCEVRTGGCASLATCLNMGVQVAAQLAEFSAFATGHALTPISNLLCPDDESTCQGSVSLTPDEVGFEVTFSHTVFDDILSLNGALNMEIPLDIDLDVDLTAPVISLYIPDVSFGFNAVFGLHFEASAVSKEYTRDFVLTDGLGICRDPLNSKRSCNPHIFYRRIIQMKYAQLDIEIGFQIVGSLTASVSASSELSAQFTISKEIVVPKLGAEVTKDGLSLLGLDEIWDDLVNTDLLDHVEFDVDGEATVAADFSINVSPQLYVVINGIEFQGGIDFVFAAAAEFTANLNSGCASGGASMSFGMLMGFYSPPFGVYSGTKAACSSIVGMAQVQEALDVIQEIQDDSYGTHCAIQYLDACDDHFDICDEAAAFMEDLMSNMVGSKMATSDIYLCHELVSVSLEISGGIMINGGSCDETGAPDTAVKCPEEHRAYSGLDDHCDSGNSEYGSRMAQRQCYVHHTEYDGDSVSNPMFLNHDWSETFTLSECQALCDSSSDSHGRPCVAIEWSDGGNVQSTGTRKQCGLAWGCDYTESWGGGSVFMKSTDGAVSVASASAKAPVFEHHEFIPFGDEDYDIGNDSGDYVFVLSFSSLWMPVVAAMLCFILSAFVVVMLCRGGMQKQYRAVEVMSDTDCA